MPSSNLRESSGVAAKGRKRRDYSLLILAAGIFLFGVAAGTLYLVLRPVTLRIAVGPPASADRVAVSKPSQAVISIWTRIATRSSTGWCRCCRAEPGRLREAVDTAFTRTREGPGPMRQRTAGTPSP